MKIAAAAALALTALPALAQTAPADRPAASQEAQTVQGSGQVQSVDVKSGALTIHHSPIATLGWPAMTMTFKASPEALKSAKAGQTVAFTLQPQTNEIVAIQPK